MRSRVEIPVALMRRVVLVAGATLLSGAGLLAGADAAPAAGGRGTASHATAAASSTAASTAASTPALSPSGSPAPFSPGLPQSGASTPTSSAPATIITNGGTAGSGSSGLSGSGIALVVVGALVLLVGIALFIWRDARRRAPVKPRGRGGDGPGEEERRSKPGSKRQTKPRKLTPAERRRRKRGRAR